MSKNTVQIKILRPWVRLSMMTLAAASLFHMVRYLLPGDLFVPIIKPRPKTLQLDLGALHRRANQEDQGVEKAELPLWELPVIIHLMF